ncbi:hypothetical protein NEOLI_005017, partial [Neolecta irregularis DAH-3]
MVRRGERGSRKTDRDHHHAATPLCRHSRRTARVQHRAAAVAVLGLCGAAGGQPRGLPRKRRAVDRRAGAGAAGGRPGTGGQRNRARCRCAAAAGHQPPRARRPAGARCRHRPSSFCVLSRRCRRRRLALDRALS